MAISLEGYVEDVNCESYWRDIGRSFKLGSYHYYLFGDTFCTQRHEYVGLVNNTAALIPDPEENPRISQYTHVDADTGIVAPFLKYTAEEERLSNPAGEGNPTRVTLWGFGGVVEVQPGVGFHWYQKGIIKQDEQNEFQGVGLAIIRSDPVTGTLSSHRYPGLVFGRDEPKIGSLSCLLHDKQLYLWGEHNNNVILARVSVDCPWQRDAYTFWTGTGWHADWHHAAVILHDMPQGQVFPSDLFGPEWPWVFVGTGCWADSKIWVGRSRTIEGPWDVMSVGVAEANHYHDGFMYCIYPHPWTVRAERGQLMLTWSEQWPGQVVAARITFPTFAFSFLEDSPCEGEEENKKGEGEEGGGVAVELV